MNFGSPDIQIPWFNPLHLFYIFYLPTTGSACKSGSGSNSLQTSAGLMGSPNRVMAATNAWFANCLTASHYFDYVLRNHESK